MRTYKLNADAAKAAHTGSNRLTDSGAYKGTLRAVFAEKSQRGAEGVFFVFDANNGTEPALLSLYTHGSDGKELMGFNTLNAIMTCLKVRELVPSKGEVELYDFDSRGFVKKVKEVFAVLAGKSVGFLLQQEEYLNSNQELRTRLNIVGAFEPSSSLMANEILDKATQPVSLQKATDWLMKNPVRALKRRPAHAGDVPSHTGMGNSQIPFEDDEIPF
jgi:hypothetical protein